MANRSGDDSQPSSPKSSSILQPENLPLIKEPETEEAEETEIHGDITEPDATAPNARTRLLESYHRGAACGSRYCNHGTFSPRIRSPKPSISSGQDMGGPYNGGIDGGGDPSDRTFKLFGHTFTTNMLPRMSRNNSKMATTKFLADRHGVKYEKLM